MTIPLASLILLALQVTGAEEPASTEPTEVAAPAPAPAPTASPARGAASGAEPATGSASALEITWLANEGFLLRHGETAALIDAFVTMPYAGYPAITAQARALLESGRPPFDEVDVALASHVHGDHFQPSPARAFLRSVPDAVFATTPQIVAQTREGLVEADAFGDRLRTVFPEPGRWNRFTHRGVEVAVMHLSHGTGRHGDIQNAGHLIQIGGLTVLHVGDAATEAENFAPYGLSGVRVDVALLPFWYWQSRTGRALIAEHLQADVYVACHLPAAGRLGIIEALTDDAPGVLVYDDPGEVRRFARDPATGMTVQR
jgi:L-ascorbate metabolism protein UlaG (beta-lactamase superfamily)